MKLFLDKVLLSIANACLLLRHRYVTAHRYELGLEWKYSGKWIQDSPDGARRFDTSSTPNLYSRGEVRGATSRDLAVRKLDRLTKAHLRRIGSL